jgi:RIO-like serine/threonine protein kinase
LASKPPPPITIASADPEVIMLQTMIKGLHHFNTRSLTLRHFKVLMAVQLCMKAMKTEPRMRDIAAFVQLPVEEFEDELRELIDKRYLHEVVPLTGELRYKLGAMGGTVLRRMVPKKDR